VRRFAKGRLKPGEMNKTEAKYAEFLESCKLTGELVWYAFEGIKLRLADRTFLTPDFFVMRGNGELECHEVKGFMEDDAAVKLKVAAEHFPFRFLLIRKAKGGLWDIREI
jgi:hypothetical protein